MTTRNEYVTTLQKLNRRETQVRETQHKLSLLLEDVEELAQLVTEMQEELDIKTYDTPRSRARKTLLAD